MNKLNSAIVATLTIFAAASASASYLSSADTSNRTLTTTRAAALAQFEHAQPGGTVTKASAAKSVSKAAAPVVTTAPANASVFAAPNLARAQGRVAYLRALKNGDVAAANYDFGTSPQFQSVTR